MAKLKSQDPLNRSQEKVIAIESFILYLQRKVTIVFNQTGFLKNKYSCMVLLEIHVLHTFDDFLIKAEHLFQ